MTTASGRLRSNESFHDMLDTGGDVYEAAEECFGMVWWLARGIVQRDGTDRPSRAQILAVIRQAVAGHQEGLRLGGVQRDR